MTISAIVFDFDGLIIDTEWSIFQSIHEIYQDHGHEVDVEWWRSIIGTVGGDDWTERLEELVGTPLDRAALDEAARVRHHALIADLMPLPGVVDLLDAAHIEGIPVAVASSSPTRWVRTHLTRLGLHTSFDAMCGRDLVGGRAKPAPDVYLAALDAVGADARHAVALEDSPHGVAAAKAAGMRCVAVPNRITAPGDFSQADMVVESVAALTLADLHARFG